MPPGRLVSPPINFDPLALDCLLDPCGEFRLKLQSAMSTQVGLQDRIRDVLHGHDLTVCWFGIPERVADGEPLSMQPVRRINEYEWLRPFCQRSRDLAIQPRIAELSMWGCQPPATASSVLDVRNPARQTWPTLPKCWTIPTLHSSEHASHSSEPCPSQKPALRRVSGTPRQGVRRYLSVRSKFPATSRVEPHPVCLPAKQRRRPKTIVCATKTSKAVIYRWAFVSFVEWSGRGRLQTARRMQSCPTGTRLLQGRGDLDAVFCGLR